MQSEEMKKILIFSNVEEGIYCFRLELLQRLIAENYDVILVAPRGSYTREFETMGVSRHFLDLNRQGMNPFEDFALLLRYIRILRKYRPSAVLTYTIKPNLYGGLACRMTGTPYLANITGVGRIFQKDGIVRRLVARMLKMALAGARKVFFQNEANMQMFMEERIVDGQAVQLLPGSGVNLDYFAVQPYPQETEPIRFLMIARLCRDKGIFELIEAAREVHKHLPAVEFHVAGWNEDSQYRSSVQDLVEAGYWHDHGVLKRDAISALIGKCHAVVLPSYHEGMANVLLEASASGRPVLASDIPGCREIVVPGQSGYVFPPKDSKALTAILLRFAALPHEERAVMGETARQKVEQDFDREIIIRHYMKSLNKK